MLALAVVAILLIIMVIIPIYRNIPYTYAKSQSVTIMFVRSIFNLAGIVRDVVLKNTN